MGKTKTRALQLWLDFVFLLQEQFELQIRNSREGDKLFYPLRKLGQGGGGSVFRGTLLNGETMAVKRLFFSTRLWVDKLFNKLNLISGIEHKNAAKLLGCSIEGPESLLVYEYVPNRVLKFASLIRIEQKS